MAFLLPAALDAGTPPAAPAWDGATAPASLASALQPAVFDVAPPPLNIEGVSVIQSTGRDGNRIGIVFLGDGYTKTEIAGAYASHVASLVSYLFTGGALVEPFARYAKFFNVYAINLVSAESGADDPATNLKVDTALNATYKFDGVTDRLLGIDSALADNAVSQGLSGTTIRPDIVFVTVNSATYGGSGGRFAVYAGGNASAREVALHEVGHSFARLADEYTSSGSGGVGGGTYTGPEPFEPNVTTSPTGAKWARWIGYDQEGIGLIGAYAGAQYYKEGLYRPSENSKMRSLDRPFDAVSREQFILHFYRLVDPIDSATPGTNLTDPAGLVIDVIDPAIIRIKWSVDGVVVADGSVEHFRFEPYNIASGTHVVTGLAYDPTEWVRADRTTLEQKVSWTVTLTQATLRSDGSRALAGGPLTDIVIASAQPDTVSGGAGVDTLSYAESTAGVVVRLVANSASGGHAAGDVIAEFENLIGSPFDDDLVGSDVANELSGGAGNDRLDGRGGADTMRGGAGDDLMVVDDARDLVIEAAGEGRDTVFARAGYALPAAAEIEILATTDYDGAAPIDLAGNGFGQEVWGNAAANRLDGGGGADHLFGGGGADSILGGDGDDHLHGDGGSDSLVGGAGLDTAHYAMSRAAAAVVAFAGAVAVLDRAAPDTDRLREIEVLRFADGSLETATLPQFRGLDYIAGYGDLIRAFGANAAAGFEHYVAAGFREGRDADRFDGLRYLAGYDDLIRAFGSDEALAVDHYIRAGFGEGRSSTAFDPLRYVASHDDLVRTIGPDASAATLHFLGTGFAAGRARDGFGALQYLATYADLAHVFGADEARGTMHFIQTGFAEGRVRDGFDGLQYIAGNDDLVRLLGANEEAGAGHYLRTGLGEGRARDGFDGLRYIAGYDDLVRTLGTDEHRAADHYIRVGFAEGRSRTAFDPFQYIAGADDLVRVFGLDAGAATRHFLQSGYAEGRARDGFDGLQYVAGYDDLIRVFGTDESAAARHYIATGLGEGRARDRFDGLQYIAAYDDLIRAYGASETAAAAHFVRWGFREGRARDGFDGLQYVASWGDLIRVFGADEHKAAAHFIAFGFGEGRARDTFDAAQYLANYPDLRAAFGADQRAATLHFIEFGYFEGRVDDPLYA